MHPRRMALLPPAPKPPLQTTTRWLLLRQPTARRRAFLVPSLAQREPLLRLRQVRMQSLGESLVPRRSLVWLTEPLTELLRAQRKAHSAAWLLLLHTS
ncbi:hypothetical protein E4T44_13502 [Aureobasidium sp. EXF-8845]|nr:hypothetical protein E4T44_13502 [Aureobasidium sp. EXF-8845]